LKILPALVFLAALVYVPFARILWACRVSVASALGGYLLFLFVEQAQDLFSDTNYGEDGFSIRHILYWSGFFFLLFFLWAFPVHYAARNILDARAGSWFRKRRPAAESDANSARRAVIDRKLIEWTPRTLGAIPIVAVLIGILSAAMQTHKAQVLVPGLGLQYSLLVAGALATLLMFVTAMMKRKRLVRRWLGDPAAERLRLFSLVLTACIFAVSWAAPIEATTYFARGILIPVLFGSWVLAFAWITKRSDRSGHPYLLYIFLAAAFLTALNAHFNDVRTLPGEAMGDGRQLELPEAVKLWREANGCPVSAEKDADVVKSCPPALIIAAEGGASRAAYFTATVVGEMLDTFKLPYLADAPTAQANNPARRIFAMSGVSGGALGFAIVKAALLDFADTKPCNKEDGKWRTCLQDLVSGDYLSPVFVGLGFRDQFAPPIFPFNDPNRWGDRAALLEIAWERQYMRASGKSPGDCEGAGEARGLCRRFGYPDNAKRWTPLLLLNGTSAETGRRIIASEIASTWPDSSKRGPNGEAQSEQLYHWAYDLFEMTGAPCPAPAPQKAPGSEATPAPQETPAPQKAACDSVDWRRLRDDAPDLRLSTAALISARFPVISPAGALRMRDGRYGDSVLDGGYFENSGLSTALDVATALEALGLKPIILSIANEPAPEALPPGQPRDDQAITPRPGGGPTIGAPLTKSIFARMFGTAYAPAVTLYDTRSGHADEAGGLLATRLQHWNVPGDLPENSPKADRYASFFPIHVYPAGRVTPTPNGFQCSASATDWQPSDAHFDMPHLSMSWWLSTAVRRALEAQLCNTDNKEQLRHLQNRLNAEGFPPVR
jgi:hypothetical protein